MANTFLAFSQNPRKAVFFCHWKDDCVYANTKAYIRWKEYILAGGGFIYINLFLVRKWCSRINFSWKDKIFGLCEFQFNNESPLYIRDISIEPFIQITSQFLRIMIISVIHSL